MSDKKKNKKEGVGVIGVSSITNIVDDTPITSGTADYEYKEVVIHKLDDSHWDEEHQSKFKIIEAGIRALHIENLGCIVHIEGNGAVFVPNAAILENPDGTFDLIKGRIFK